MDSPKALHQNPLQGIRTCSDDSIESICDDARIQAPNSKLIQPETRSSKVKYTFSKFYVLLLFSLLCFLQNIFVNTWGPIADSAELALNRNDQGTTIAWLSNSAAIAFLPGTVIFYLIINYSGLRSGVVIASLLVSLCGVLRCFIFSISSIYGIILLFFAQFLNGFAGPVVVSATTQLSANWFPSNQRSVATAISGQSSNIGISLSFILGPLLVPDVNISSFISSTTKSDVTSSILRLLYIEAVAAIAVLSLIVLYFPSKPISAPSLSATVQRLDFVASLKCYFHNTPLILLSLCYAIPVGVNTGWYGFLYPNLRKLSVHVTQKYVGWLGFYMSMSGAISAILFSKLADCFPRKKKLLVVALFSTASLLLVLFSIVCLDFIHIGDNIYIILTLTGISCGIFLSAVDPLLKELIVEVGFPIAEFNSTLIASIIFDIIMVIFFGIASLSFLGTTWINWFQTAVYMASTLMLLVTPIKLRRLDRDVNHQ